MTGIGVIGMGAVSADHLAGVAEVGGAQVVAVCDVDPERLATGPSNARHVEDWRDLISLCEVEAVLILLPHKLHHPVAAAALDAGKHVCVEKPMAVDREQCIDLLRRARRAGKQLTVAENARFVAAYREAETQLKTLGEIRLVRAFVHGSAVANYCAADAGWRIQAAGIGAVIDAAPHPLYLLRWLLGPVAFVQATTRHWVRERIVPAMEVEDGALISGRMVSGAHFTCEISLAAELPWGERLELYGDSGAVVVDLLAAIPVVRFDGPADIDGRPVGELSRNVTGWQSASIRAAARDFAEAVRDDRAPAVLAADAAYAVELIGCAYQSATAGGLSVAPVDVI